MQEPSLLLPPAFCRYCASALESNLTKTLHPLGAEERFPSLAPVVCGAWQSRRCGTAGPPRVQVALPCPRLGLCPAGAQEEAGRVLGAQLTGNQAGVS